MTNQKKILIIILGPTAAGKTETAVKLAENFGSEIFSCDSRQFYKQLNIGVAKPDEHQLERIRHHFIGHIDIENHYSISKFETDAINALSKYFQNNNIAIMTGGSGLYINAITNGVDEMPDYDPQIRQKLTKQYETEGIESLRFELQRIDPEYYNKVDLKNPQRILRALEVFHTTGKPFSEFRTSQNAKRDFEIIKVGINLDREILYNKINDRVDIMIKNGLIEEAKMLHKYKNLVALKTIGYTELFMYLENKICLEEAVELIKRNSRRYARRQMTWFRRDDEIKWFLPDEIKNIISFLNNKK
jgi:tRNA dimethylallyltransferase